jgi:hypothetical protein
MKNQMQQREREKERERERKSGRMCKSFVTVPNITYCVQGLHRCVNLNAGILIQLTVFLVQVINLVLLQ